MGILDWVAIIFLGSLFVLFWSIGPIQILKEHWKRGEKKEGIRQGILTLIGVIIFLFILMILGNMGSGGCPSGFPYGYDC